MPFKTFVNDEFLEATEVNDYLMEQTVMTFASAAARTAALTAPTEGMVTYLNDTNLLYVYNGTSWNVVPSGSVDQTLVWTKAGNMGSAAVKMTYLSSHVISLNGVIPCTVADATANRQFIQGMPAPAQSFTQLHVSTRRASDGVRTDLLLCEESGTWFVVASGGNTGTGYTATVAVNDSLHINASYRVA